MDHAMDDDFSSIYKHNVSDSSFHASNNKGTYMRTTPINELLAVRNPMAQIPDTFDTMNTDDDVSNNTSISLCRGSGKQQHNLAANANTYAGVDINCRSIFYQTKGEQNDKREDLVKTKLQSEKDIDNKVAFTEALHEGLYQFTRKGYCFILLSVFINLPWIIFIRYFSGSVSYTQQPV